MTVAQTKRLLANVQIARSLLAAIETGCNLRIEAGSTLTAAELSRLDAFWQQQLSHAIAELDSARRLTEGGKP